MVTRSTGDRSSILCVSYDIPEMSCSSSHLQNSSIVASNSPRSAQSGSNSGDRAFISMKSDRLGRIDCSHISSLLSIKFPRSSAMTPTRGVHSWTLLLGFVERGAKRAPLIGGPLELLNLGDGEIRGQGHSRRSRQGLHQVLPCLLEEVLRVFH